MSVPGRAHGGGVETRVAELERKLAVQSGAAAGTITATGTVSLATGAATSTVATDANIASTSLIYLAPTSSGAWSVDAGISAITPASGQFTVTHAASSLTRSYNYIAITPP